MAPAGAVLRGGGGEDARLAPPRRGKADARRLRVQRPAQLSVSLLDGADGSQTDRAVRYGDAELVGRDPLFPRIGGFQPVRAPISLFPSDQLKVDRAPPTLLSRLNAMLKDSGLFQRELGAGYLPGVPQSEPTRARLDVLRVAFALYAENTKAYRSFLGMVQAEYEGHVNLLEAALTKASTLQEYVTVGDDYRAAAISDMKAKWRDKLKAAHAAVVESKALYDKVSAENTGLKLQLEQITKQRAELTDEGETLMAEMKKLTEENLKLKTENESLSKLKNGMDRLEGENMYIKEMSREMQEKIANMKTDLEMQDVRYTKQTQEHRNFKSEIKQLRLQLKEWTSVKHSVSPRPEWKRLQGYLSGLTISTSQRTKHLSERLALDLRFHSGRPFMSLFTDLARLSETDAGTKMEIVSSNNSVPSSPTAGNASSDNKRSSMFAWGSTLRTCPHLGVGSLIPCFLRTETPVVVAEVSSKDLKQFIKEFWHERETNPGYHQLVMPEALHCFIASFGSTEKGARELSYSMCFALQDQVPRSSDAALFFHAMMMNIDSAAYFCVTEIRQTLSSLLATAAMRHDPLKFLRQVLKAFPWAVNIQAELTVLLQPYIDAELELDPKQLLAATSTGISNSFSEFLVLFFISHRRRLLQRIFHGLTFAASQAFPSEQELSGIDLLRRMVTETFLDIDESLTKAELEVVVKCAIAQDGAGRMVNASTGQPLDMSASGRAVLEYIKTHRDAHDSENDAIQRTRSPKSQQKVKKEHNRTAASAIWPQAHKLFPRSDSTDTDEEDVRVRASLDPLLRLLLPASCSSCCFIHFLFVHSLCHMHGFINKSAFDATGHAAYAQPHALLP